jgi:hypothetical protein
VCPEQAGTHFYKGEWSYLPCRPFDVCLQMQACLSSPLDHVSRAAVPGLMMNADDNAGHSVLCTLGWHDSFLEHLHGLYKCLVGLQQ